MIDTRQQDLFAQQLDLLAPPKREAPAGAPRNYHTDHDRAFSDEVKAALLAVYAAHPGEFLDSWRNRQLRDVIEKHKISSWYGHVLFSLARDGKLESQNVYFGSDHPSKPNYQGYRTEYRIINGEQNHGNH